ncbi:dTDP-4-dehydrorhamnose 3,5-epimerase [Thiovibrio frasassiensis]|uniref:dTDP-4-dehydrorhamnose 3,5-epimerase n=1 Tax=Thiovibrio frasassiensis TaxID=2984131 RepID=A0A9X4MER1_9BACT|nr:dTDP-4-dehydrorhamnose 3,5-epimerase [Thiovibrio frasassiensis]MDG4474795.1 dTDP-4-dehydrorhamnose 3,5-epimerase [Thiovibrio frasassiensis]
MKSCFALSETPLPGLTLLQRKPFGDNRGFFERLFCHQELQAFVPGKNIMQINHTLTTKIGTIRGIHFQYPPHTETKLVSCLHGEVYDVAVDLRQGSPTFLRWHAEILSGDNHKTLIIPEGFAHGFQTLTEKCEMLYLHTAAYHPNAEGGIHSQDPRLAIRWPLPISVLSSRDATHQLLLDDFTGITI